MLHITLSPLSEKVINYLSEYHDFVYYRISKVLKGYSDTEIFASLDELELNEMVSFRNFPSIRDVEDDKIRVLDISEIEGRMERD